MDITAAVSFVESRGTGLEKARLKWILYGVAPDPWVVIALLERQYENGGFARKIGELTAEIRPIEFESKEIKLSETNAFTWRRNLPLLKIIISCHQIEDALVT